MFLEISDPPLLSTAFQYLYHVHFDHIILNPPLRWTSFVNIPALFTYNRSFSYSQANKLLIFSAATVSEFLIMILCINGMSNSLHCSLEGSAVAFGTATPSVRSIKFDDPSIRRSLLVALESSNSFGSINASSSVHYKEIFYQFLYWEQFTDDNLMRIIYPLCWIHATNMTENYRNLLSANPFSDW